MARFKADIHGSRGSVSRLGGESSGIWGHIRGWSLGIEVYGFVDDEGSDCFNVYVTTGSGGSGARELLAVVHNVEDIEVLR